MWFKSIHSGGNVELPIYDASNGPDTAKAWSWDTEKKTFVDANLEGLTPYDKACTGVNQTIFSTVFYRAFEEQEAGGMPVSAAPCWRPGGFPVEIQNVTSWISTGCAEGFLCSFALGLAYIHIANGV
jgi:hypothetical protein